MSICIKNFQGNLISSSRKFFTLRTTFFHICCAKFSVNFLQNLVYTAIEFNNSVEYFLCIWQAASHRPKCINRNDRKMYRGIKGIAIAIHHIVAIFMDIEKCPCV